MDSPANTLIQHIHAHTHTHSRARVHIHTHTLSHTLSLSLSQSLTLSGVHYLTWCDNLQGMMTHKTLTH